MIVKNKSIPLQSNQTTSSIEQTTIGESNFLGKSCAHNFSPFLWPLKGEYN